ncbi:MAG: hypothetical protein ABSH16_07095 [Sedimentisphaerales bacterium]
MGGIEERGNDLLITLLKTNLMAVLSSLTKRKQLILAIFQNMEYSLKKPDSYEQNLASEEGDEKPIKNAEI